MVTRVLGFWQVSMTNMESSKAITLVGHFSYDDEVLLRANEVLLLATTRASPLAMINGVPTHLHSFVSRGSIRYLPS
jgi:hypothetical protein